jgi:hypothetical protein
MDTEADVNNALHLMGEPPLGEHDVVQSNDQVVEVVADADGKKEIQLVDPPGHRRANMVFLNGRHLFIDMQDDELLQLVDEFLEDPNPKRKYLTLPLIDVVGKEPHEVVAAAPIHLTRKALELLQSIGRSWVPKVPGQATTDSKIPVIRGSEAEQLLNQVGLNRSQRRRLQYVGRDGG